MHSAIDGESRVLAGDARSGSALIAAITRHAEERPEAEAVGEVDGAGAGCTYGDLAVRVSARARQLREAMPPGGVVVAVLPGGVEYIEWFCGAIVAGVRFLPMHTQIAGPEALRIAERAGAVRAVMAPGVTAEKSLDHLAMKLVGSCGAWAPADRAGGVVLGSSGTMGLPKLALRERESLDATAAAVVEGMRLTAADRVVSATPLSHSYGVDVLLGVLTAGATLRVMQQFDSEVLAREIETGATVLPGVPFIFEALARRSRGREARLRLALSAGSPLSARVGREFIDAWGVEVGQLYGATELGTVAMDVPGTEGFDPASVGRPLRGVSMRVVDIEDPRRSLGVGEEGHLAVSAPSMLNRYLDGDVPMVEGHFLTGDLARIEGDGRVWITGRLKSLIDVGAYKVNPLEVEGVLGLHPAVAECVVVPINASDTLRRVRAVVVLRRCEPHPTAESLRRFLRERLSPIKVPRVVEVVEALPKSPAGKVLRDRV